MGFSDDCIEAAGPVWERWLHHPWTEALFAGELSDERFRYWLIQDLPYLGQRITDPVHPKVPAHVPFVELSHEYAVRADTTRVELETIRDLGDFAKTRWAARPMREAAINFWLRAAHEGSFGDFCASLSSSCWVSSCDSSSDAFSRNTLFRWVAMAVAGSTTV